MSLPAPIERIVRAGILPIARRVPSSVLAAAAAVLRQGGVDVIEVTMDSADAVEAIRKLRSAKDALVVGAGTVRSREAARQAVEAGAQFLVTPHVDAAVAEEARRLEVPVILGAMTPTEISQAQALGSTLVKVFPAASLGPDYLRQVLAPLREVRLLPTGGITAANAAEFIRAGAAAVGVGSSLLGSRAADTRALADAVAALRRAVEEGRMGGARTDA